MGVGKYRRVLYTILIDITGLSSAIFLTINMFFLFELTINQHIIQLVGLSKTRILANYYQLMTYLEVPWVTKLKLDDFPFSLHGMEHMSQVKTLFAINLAVMIVSLSLMFCLYYRVKRLHQWWELIVGLENSLILFPIVIATISLNFNHWFIVFHKLLFNNDYWIFDPAKDPIIQVLPDSFFGLCFIVIFLIFEIYLALSFWVVKKQIKL